MELIWDGLVSLFILLNLDPEVFEVCWLTLKVPELQPC